MPFPFSLTKGFGLILPKERDQRLITLRRGGTLSDHHHHLLALWSAVCAEHVLHVFEEECPADPRPRQAIAAIRGWVAGEVAMMEARAAGGHAMGAARPLSGGPRFAAYAAGQAAAVAHVAAHDLGAAAYAIRAAGAHAANPDIAMARECAWQQAQLPEEIRELVLDDQHNRNPICWNVFTFPE